MLILFVLMATHDAINSFILAWKSVPPNNTFGCLVVDIELLTGLLDPRAVLNLLQKSSSLRCVDAIIFLPGEVRLHFFVRHLRFLVIHVPFRFIIKYIQENIKH